MKNSQKKKYLCIFPKLMNFHLIKDVGLLPYTMGKSFNYDAAILTYNNDSYDYLKEELNSEYLNLIFLNKKFKTETRDVLCYLIKNSRKIDVLQSFHLHDTLGIFSYFLVYKLLNPKGKTYVKLDADDLITSILISKKGVFGFLQKITIKHLIDCISVESSKQYKKLIETGTISPNKLINIPNGIYINYTTKIPKKKNYILTVGNLGTPAKATEVLLEAFSKIEKLEDWKLILIGSIEKSFEEEYIKKYFIKNPHLKDKVIFKGYVSDRDEIYKFYSQSKIFCFPSRSESFGIALIEAAYFGNYLVTTDVGGAKDLLKIIDSGELIKMDDSDYLAERLQKLILNPEKLGKNPKKIMKEVNENYNWSNLCKKIYKMIN